MKTIEIKKLIEEMGKCDIPAETITHMTLIMLDMVEDKVKVDLPNIPNPFPYKIGDLPYGTSEIKC